MNECEPLVPGFPGSDTFPGAQMHSHNYREPSPFFDGKNVVVLGAMVGRCRVPVSATEVNPPLGSAFDSRMS